MIQMKFELDAFPNLSDSNVYLEFKLLFTSRYYFDQHDIENFQGTALETCKLKLESLESGIMHYCEAEFVENYLSKFSFTISMMLMDYKFSGYKSKLV